MRQDNIFVFGSEVEGESFLGRKHEIEELTKAFRSQSGIRGHAIIGLNRVGKSSLIKKIISQEFRGEPKTVLVEMNLMNCDGKDLFWNKLACGLRDEIDRLAICDSEIERQFVSLGKYGIESNGMMTRLPDDCIKNILKCLDRLGIRVVVVLDEFDRASNVFLSTPGSFGLIRDMPSKADLRNVTLITLSRRGLPAIEGVVKGSTSTLDGVFFKYELCAFSEDDMKSYWGALSDYWIFLDEATKKKLIWYTGRQPYLLSLYGNRMAEASISGKQIDINILEHFYKEERNGRNIRDYYDTMFERMKEDGHVEIISGILYGPIVGIAKGDVDMLCKGGYISKDEEGYYTISRDYTEYFRDMTQNLGGKIWEQIMGAERILKNMIRVVFPELEKRHYLDLKGKSGWSTEIQRIYPQVKLSEHTILNFMRDAYKYGKNPSITDVLTLTFQVDLIKKNWIQFSSFFGSGDCEEWFKILDLLVRARKPLAHDNPEYLTDVENGLVQIYCKEILRLQQPLLLN